MKPDSRKGSDRKWFSTGWAIWWMSVIYGTLKHSYIREILLIHVIPRFSVMKVVWKYTWKSIEEGNNILKINFVYHVRIHFGDMTYQCSLYGKDITQKGCLVEHQIIHSGEKLFHRSYCIKHLEIHIGEKPYECTHCDKY